MARNSKLTFKIFYDGKEVTELPEDARQRYRERWSEVASRYFSANPDVYEKFLKGLEAQGVKIRYIDD